jgi:hypothetical protein
MSDEVTAAQLERERFELEKTKAQQDYAFRQRELGLKERELELKASETQAEKWRNPLILAIAAATLGGFTSIAVTFLQNRGNQQIAHSKAQSDLIIESTRTADPAVGKKNLLFFVKAKLIDDPEGKITELINQDLYPSLPPAVASERAQKMWMGESPDYAEALRLFRIAADQGDTRAMANIGWIYENGFGLPQRDCPKAMEWYRKAVNGGDKIAIWNIGHLYEIGCGVNPDCHEAKKWYERAAAQGIPEAIRDLPKLEQSCR